RRGARPEGVRAAGGALVARATGRGGAPDAPGAGAAGGAAYGLRTAWGASLASGADAIARLTGLDAAIASADLVITGEGRVDASSAGGKVVSAVLRRADAVGTPVALGAGSVADGTDGTGAARPLRPR